jgi:DNA polymerase-3 subunit delta'
MPFTDIVGQDGNIAMLKRSLASGRLAHAYLFEGIEGCGKRKTALALVAALFCERGEGCGICPPCRKIALAQHPDLHLIEPDGAFIKIDQIRELQKELALRPYEAPRKACIIEAADRLNPASGNALLKTLEEPPGHALLVLLTANRGGVLPTILSRCQQLHFPALPETLIADILRTQGSSPEMAAIAASLAGGSLKKALEIETEEALAGRKKFLERMTTFSLKEIALIFTAAEELATDRETASEMLELLTAFLRDVLHLQGGMQDVVNTDLLPLLKQEAVKRAAAVTMERIERVNEARSAIQRNVNLRLALEVLFMRLAAT